MGGTSLSMASAGPPDSWPRLRLGRNQKISLDGLWGRAVFNLIVSNVSLIALRHRSVNRWLGRNPAESS